MKASKLLFVVLFVCVCAGSIFPQEKRGDYLTEKIAVMGAGSELYLWWGHLGLIIDDALTGESFFYDYGVFSFENDNFFRNFALGRLLYSSTVSPTSKILNRYKEDNRDITLYTLNLDADQKEAIRKAAELNALPENRDYLYNHFKDNCVTRVLNLLDDAIGGQLYEQTGNTPGRFTLRQHVRRNTYFSPFFDWFLSFIMGQNIDEQTTVRQEMFLPSEVGRVLSDLYYTDENGQPKKLISKIDVVNRSVGRPPVLDAPRLQWPRELILGMIIAALLLCCNYVGKSRSIPRSIKMRRNLFGIANSVLGLFFGATGSIAFFMCLFTNHDYSWHNMNIIFVNPLLLCAVPLGIMSIAAKSETKKIKYAKVLQGLWTYVFLGGILCMLLKLLPMFYQKNGDTLALVLPIAFAASFAPDWIMKIIGEKCKHEKQRA